MSQSRLSADRGAPDHIPGTSPPGQRKFSACT
jgi:hypothetical protein